MIVTLPADVIYIMLSISCILVVTIMLMLMHEGCGTINSVLPRIFLRLRDTVACAATVFYTKVNSL